MKNTQSASATPRRLRRRLTSALLALTFIVWTIAATATPVQAAGMVSACFTPDRGRIVVRGLPVMLQAWVAVNTHVTIATSVLDSVGCATFLVNPAYTGYYLRTYIETRPYGNYYRGASYLYAPPGKSGFYILWGLVTCTGC